MLHRRDFLSLLGISGLLIDTEAKLASAQSPAKVQRKGAGSGLARIEEIVEETLEEYEIRGASLAMAKDGKLVLARGFGMADFEAKKPVTTETLFSIASVTKPISSVAILRLVEMGKLKLDDRLMVILADIQPLEGKQPADPRFRDITIHQMLYHGSGLGHSTAPPGREVKASKKDDDDNDNDEISPERIVENYRRAMSQPLDFAPGSAHRYSNVAFSILQLVIARVSGQPYEKWVKEHVLEPAGITRMVMETDSFIPAETRRYARGKNGVRTVALHQPSNWLATPTDLVRFLTVVSRSRGKPLLSEKHFKLMVALPPAPIKPGKDGRHVGLGWDVVQPSAEGVRFSKNGGKIGVRAWLEHLPNGVDWAFQYNTNDLPALPPKTPVPLNLVAQKVAEVALNLKRWPEVDLFKTG